MLSLLLLFLYGSSRAIIGWLTIRTYSRAAQNNTTVGQSSQSIYSWFFILVFNKSSSHLITSLSYYFFTQRHSFLWYTAIAATVSTSGMCLAAKIFLQHWKKHYNHGATNFPDVITINLLTVFFSHFMSYSDKLYGIPGKPCNVTFNGFIISHSYVHIYNIGLNYNILYSCRYI